MTELICILCPKGCHLKVYEDEGFRVTGFSCPKGEHYGRKELTNPTRVVTSTVKLRGGKLNRVPVKTSSDIPKELVFEAMRLLDDVELTSPVHIGDVAVKDICGTGVDFLVTRNM